MGTDIYPFVFQKKDNVWVKAEENLGSLDVYPDEEFNRYTWGNLPRDYEFFGLIAGVRGDIEPLEKPKGIPAQVIGQGVGDSWCPIYSYYSLTDLLIYKELEVDVEYDVDITDYIKYKNGEYVRNSRWFYDREFISNVEMDRVIKMQAFIDKKYATEITYKKPIKNICPYFWNEYVCAMQKLDSNTDNVMFVFGID